MNFGFVCHLKVLCFVCTFVFFHIFFFVFVHSIALSATMTIHVRWLRENVVERVPHASVLRLVCVCVCRSTDVSRLSTKFDALDFCCFCSVRFAAAVFLFLSKFILANIKRIFGFFFRVFLQFYMASRGV